jgi:hypothetical protein
VEEAEEDILPKFYDAVDNQTLSELGEQFTQAKERALADLNSPL